MSLFEIQKIDGENKWHQGCQIQSVSVGGGHREDVTASWPVS